MTDTALQIAHYNEISQDWQKLWEFARSSVDFDGDIDFETFCKNGAELFDVKIKDAE